LPFSIAKVISSMKDFLLQTWVESAMLPGPGPSLRIGAIIGVVVFIVHFTNAGK
jgi:hypothetical protein